MPDPRPEPRAPRSLPPTVANDTLTPHPSTLLNAPGDKRYAVGDVLGQGGMGIVYRAADRDLRREVAVKAMLGDRGADLFLREAQLTSQLEHPNIVPVHDVGLTADGRAFFTMKVVGGRAFDEILKRSHAEARPLRADLEVLLRACDAVAFAHSRGVVHRDLKPSNLMVGEFGEVLVMDWGLATVAGSPESKDATPIEVKELGKSLDGAVVGTPSYMPPEQAMGDPVDARADVYALGAILYQILVGVPPVTGKTVAEVLVKAQEGGFPSPEDYPAGERAAALRARGVPPELSAIAMKALSKDPSARYDSVKTLQTDVRRYLEGREVSARRDPIPVRVLKWVRRHRVTTAVAVTALAALAVVFVQSYLIRRQIRLSRESAAAVHRNSARMLMNSSRIEGDRRRAVEFLLAADDDLRAAEQLLGSSLPERYDVNLHLGDRALEGTDYALARMAFSACKSIDPPRAARERLEQRVDDAETALARERTRRIGEILADLRAGLGRAGRPPDAPKLEDYVFEAVGYREELTVRLLSEALAKLRDKASKYGRRATWTQPERDVVKFAVRTLGRIGLPPATEPLTALMRTLWDPELAVECGLALCNTRDHAAHVPLADARDRFGPDSPTWKRIVGAFGRVPDPPGAAAPVTADDFDSRGVLRRDKGDLLRALEDFSRAIDLDDEHFDAWMNRARTRRDLGLKDAALKDYNRAVELRPGAVEGYNNRGNLKQALRDFKGAIEDYNLALRLSPKLATTILNRGIARLSSGDPDGALLDFDRVMELEPQNDRARIERARCRCALGRVTDALEDFDQAVALGTEDAKAFNDRAAVLWTLGRLLDALRDFDRAVELEPGDSILYSNRGALRWALGKFDGAEEDFTQAVEIDERNARAHSGLGMIFARKEDATQAVVHLNRAIELDPELAEAYGARGDISRTLRRWREMIADFEKVLDLQPAHPKADQMRAAIDQAREEIKREKS